MRRPAKLDQAYRECRRIARSHAENFSLGSLLLPRRMRGHLAALYAFARTADDIADEGNASTAERLSHLDAYAAALEDCLAGRATDPIFVALGATVRELDLPAAPLRDLLVAFRRDAGFRPFADFAELRDYCRCSADPVGRLVLALFGVREPHLQELADGVCTGLQLANFWQDLSVDLPRGRLTLPLADLDAFGVSRAELGFPRTTHRVRRLLRFEVERAREFLARGEDLARRVDGRLGREVRLFAAGGFAILERIEAADFEVLAARPSLGRIDKARTLVRILAARPAAAAATAVTTAAAVGTGGPGTEDPTAAALGAGTVESAGGCDRVKGRGAAAGSAGDHERGGASGDATRGPDAARDAAGPEAREAAVQRAYAECRDVVARSASSFLPAFRLLPPDRRDALCAVYAFCRHVDDIADEPSRQDPAVLLARWRGEVDAAFDGTPTRPISLALADAARRFGLRREVLLDVIRGVEMDLVRHRYETIDELEEYCARVASAVGLLCIEIFGYRNPSAREYARDLGLAFQLTNILRDVCEDGRRNRLYLPLEDLRRFGVPEEDLLAGRYTPRVAALMAFECGRARAWYLRARGALAAEDRRSLGAAEAMRAIYERLLDRIEARNFDVFGPRIALPSYEKVGLALAGWGRARFAVGHA